MQCIRRTIFTINSNNDMVEEGAGWQWKVEGGVLDACWDTAKGIFTLDSLVGASAA